MSAESPAARERFHAFDALRAFMMLLGIVLHSMACYTSGPIPMAPYWDPQTSPVFDWGMAFIHTFRLPVFFVMAGFFAAFLMNRDGVRGMLRNRWRRIFVPLLVAWPVLAPLVILAVVFALRRHPSFETGIYKDVTFIHPHRERDGLLMHLWFLYDLFLFCLAAAAAHWAVSRFKLKRAARVALVLGKQLQKGRALLLLILATILTLYPMQTGTFDTSAWIFPPLRILAAYGIFFAFGWILFQERDRLEFFKKGALPRILCACLAFIPHQAGLATMQSQLVPPGSPVHWITIVTGAIACWWLVYGLTGLCLQYFHVERPWVRYLTDASYWLYLAHLPVVIFLQGLMATWAVPAMVKFLVVVTLATASLVLVYDWVVRNSQLGERLNGRRLPRVIFRTEPFREVSA